MDNLYRMDVQTSKMNKTLKYVLFAVLAAFVIKAVVAAAMLYLMP